ncbi:ATP-binding protein [Actinomadura opuntiae]|uniref:ATP-binding protein n=1 Tax=Actinomadura sp. OS1-43 TaxID=604315 RepID=UPI00255AB8B7|nr:helix-turn-helix transcriptional regulator [Actinomadura sp. OS1-43]MDL4820080.1 AAA family ATPase [Actinomadura sp. OS1-43]
MTGSVVSPVLVGRDDEIAALREAYERARAGRPGTVLVSGEAGIGKSRLVAGALRELPGDPLVLSGGCLELGSEGAPYVPFVAVLRDLVRRFGRERVAALLPPGGAALGDWLPDLGPAPARYGPTRLLEEMLTLLGRVAEARPAVVVIEDLHWADASSRELFAYLARNLARAAVMMVGTVRTGEPAAGHPNRRVLAELGRSGAVERIALGPLKHRHVAALLAAVDGRPPDPARSVRVHRRSGGNPLFVEALSSASEAPPGDLRTLLLTRITDLPDPAREALEVMAVAGTELPDDLVREVAGGSGRRLQAALDELTGRELAVAWENGYAIRHDLIRETVYDALPPTRRRSMHARYAAVLAERTGGGTEGGMALADHWTAAGEFERALPAAWHAADRAARQNAYDEQLHLLELVVEQWAKVPAPFELIGADRAAVLERAATAAFAAGKSAAGVAYGTAALEELGPAARPERVARLLGLRGRLQSRLDGGGLDDLQRAVALVPPGSADPLRSRLLSALAFAEFMANRSDGARRHATEALDIAGRLGDDALRAPALLVLASLHGASGDLEEAGRAFAEARRTAEAAEDWHTFLTTYQWEATALAAAGRYEEAAGLARTGQRAAERLGQGRSRGSMLASARAFPLCSLGRWDEALEIVRDALAMAPPPLYAAYLRFTAAEIAQRRGETDRVETLLRQLTEFAWHTRGAIEAKSWIALLRIAHALGRDDPETADRIVGEHLVAARDAWPEHERAWLAVLGARTQRARRAAAPRNRRVACETADRLAELSRLLGSLRAVTPAADAQRRTFHAETAPGDLPAWDGAAAAWRDLGNRYETAVLLVEGAAAALASNNRPGARSRLREARAIADELGAAPLRSRIDDLAARGRLTDTAGGASGNDFGLTRRELDVLRLLARGRSNQDIATELFISVNTVATHVTRILTKLGAASRTQAAAKARETGLLDDQTPG